MGALAVASVVLVKFPFSDLSGAKLRPAVVLACCGDDDWILCQITSNPYADMNALEIGGSDFVDGSLERTSYIRPGKLFTGNNLIIDRRIGAINSVVFSDLVGKVVALIQGKEE